MAEPRRSSANSQSGRRGLERIWHAGLISLQGLRTGWGETAFRQEAMLAIVAIPLAFWLGQDWVQVALLVGSVMLVLIVELLNSGIEAAIDRMRRRIGDKPLYISIDIDVLDPAHAPGTGTPEAGGLTSRELLRMLRALSDSNVVGADVVEVSPAYDHAQVTGIAASHVVYELVSLMASRLGSTSTSATTSKS